MPADPSSAAVARRFVRDALDGWGAAEFEDAALLLTSELVTNALLHARSAPDLTVRLLDGRLRVSVADDVPAPPTLKRYGTDAATGRGLLLIESMASDWGSEAASDGKVVWFELVSADNRPSGAAAASRRSRHYPAGEPPGETDRTRQFRRPPSSPGSSRPSGRRVRSRSAALRCR